MNSHKFLDELNRRLATTTKDFIGTHTRAQSKGYCQAIVDMMDTGRAILAEEDKKN